MLSKIDQQDNYYSPCNPLNFGLGCGSICNCNNGLGDVASNQLGHQIASGTLATGASIAGIVGATMFGVPIVGPILGGLALLAGFLFKPDLKKIATTHVVDQAEILMKQNLSQWNSLSPSQKTPEIQAQALDAFNQIWNAVTSNCSSPDYGSAGVNCVNDRKRGGKWDWFSYYYDPIANDPQIIINSQSQNSSIVSGASNIISSIIDNSGFSLPLLIGLGLATIGIGMMD